MKQKDLRSSLFDNPWPSGTVSLTLSSGEHLPVVHRDYVLVPPDEDFAIVVTPGRGFRVLDLDQIVSVDFTRKIPK